MAASSPAGRGGAAAAGGAEDPGRESPHPGAHDWDPRCVATRTWGQAGPQAAAESGSPSVPPPCRPRGAASGACSPCPSGPSLGCQSGPVPPPLKDPPWLPAARDRHPGPKSLPSMAWCPVTHSRHPVTPGPFPPRHLCSGWSLGLLGTSSRFGTCSGISSSLKLPSYLPTKC